jgi:MFS family permease
MKHTMEDKNYEIIKNTQFNFFLNSTNAAFYTVAMSFASIITLLPLFIQKLGGSNLQIGLIPALAFLGYMVPGIFTANHIEKLPRKLSFVQKITLMERIPFIILALSCLSLARTNPKLTIFVVLFCLVLITFTSGLITPAWLGYIVKVTPGNKLGTFFSFGSGVGGFMGIGASIMASWFLTKYPFPMNFFYCFLWASIAVFISYYCTLIGREPAIDNPSLKPISLFAYFNSIPAILQSDKNFMHYIVCRNFLCLGSMATTFYVVFASKELHFADQYAGYFSIFLLASQSLTFFLWGYIGDRFSHRFVLIMGVIGLLFSSILVLVSHSAISLFCVFISMGIYYSAFGSSGLAILNRWAPRGKYPTYIALSNGLTAICAIIAPIVGGKITDIYGFTTLFSFALAFTIIGLLWMIFLIKEGACKD